MFHFLFYSFVFLLLLFGGRHHLCGYACCPEITQAYNCTTVGFFFLSFLSFYISAHTSIYAFICFCVLACLLACCSDSSTDSVDSAVPTAALISDSLRILNETVPFNPLFPIDDSEQMTHHAAIRHFLPAWRGPFEPKIMVDWLGVRTNQKWDCGGHNGGGEKMEKEKAFLEKTHTQRERSVDRLITNGLSLPFSSSFGFNCCR